MVRFDDGRISLPPFPLTPLFPSPLPPSLLPHSPLSPSPLPSFSHILSYLQTSITSVTLSDQVGGTTVNASVYTLSLWAESLTAASGSFESLPESKLLATYSIDV